MVLLLRIIRTTNINCLHSVKRPSNCGIRNEIAGRADSNEAGAGKLSCQIRRGSRGSGPPLCPPRKISSKSCSFQAILRENPYFDQFLGSGPSWGQNSAGPPHDQNPGSVPPNSNYFWVETRVDLSTDDLLWLRAVWRLFHLRLGKETHIREPVGRDICKTKEKLRICCEARGNQHVQRVQRTMTPLVRI